MRVRVAQPNPFVVVDDNDYQAKLCRQEGDDEYTPMHLWEVTQTVTHKVMVMAESEEAACSQASTIRGMEKAEASAVQVPFLLRGWSSTEF